MKPFSKNSREGKEKSKGDENERKNLEKTTGSLISRLKLNLITKMAQPNQ